MSANIRTTIYDTEGGSILGAPVTGASRNDLAATNYVVAEAVDVAATYLWSLTFTPTSPSGAPSTTVFLAPENNTSQTCRFYVDFEGSYNLRLVRDSTLMTETTQVVRLRALTRFGSLGLVASGEQNSTDTIPVDIGSQGWGKDQNINLHRLLAFTRRTATSGRVLFVDANKGRDNTLTANDITNVFSLPGSDTADVDGSGISVIASSHGDFATIQAAIAYAADAVARGEPALSASQPYTIFVQPGLYIENLTLSDFVNLVGLSGPPANFAVSGLGLPESQPSVTVRTNGSAHLYAGSGAVTLKNLTFERTDTLGDCFRHTGGLLWADGCNWIQKNSSTAYASFRVVNPSGGTYNFFTRCTFKNVFAPPFVSSVYTFVFDSPAGTQFEYCDFNGSGCLQIAPASDVNYAIVNLSYCTLQAYGSGFALRGPTELNAVFSDFKGICQIDRHGIATSVVSDLNISLSHCNAASLVFNTSCTSGNLNVSLNATTGAVSLPTGSPNTFTSGLKAYSVGYDTFATNPHWTNGVPVVKRLTGNIVGSLTLLQDALDELSVRAGTRIVATASSSPYTMTWGQEILCVSPGAPFSVVLPASPPMSGIQVTIKDVGGTASVNHITVSTSDATTIDGDSSVVLNANYGFLTLFFNGTNWYSF